MPLGAVRQKELTYYRVHFREAIQKTGIVCLECGLLFKSLPQHVGKHRFTSHEYKAKWGYNRTTPLVVLSTHRRRRRVALRMNLPALSPRNSLTKALKARRGRPSPHRPENRTAQIEAAQARVAMGFRPAELRAKDDALRRLIGQGLRAREIAERTSLSYRHVRKRLRALGLKAGLESHFEPAKRDLKILSLRKKGLWASEIAPLVGMQIRSVDKRFARLKSQGFTIPPPKGPRPNAQRKVTDEKLLAFVQLRLSVREIASRIGMARTNVYLRLRRLKKRGLWKRF